MFILALSDVVINLLTTNTAPENHLNMQRVIFWWCVRFIQACLEIFFFSLRVLWSLVSLIFCGAKRCLDTTLCYENVPLLIAALSLSVCDPAEAAGCWKWCTSLKASTFPALKEMSVSLDELCKQDKILWTELLSQGWDCSSSTDCGWQGLQNWEIWVLLEWGDHREWMAEFWGAEKQELNKRLSPQSGTLPEWQIFLGRC